MLTQDRLKALLTYDPLTGLFVRNVNKGRAKKGDVAGCTISCGYVEIGIDGERYPAHRLAFLYMTGSFPEADGEHENRKRSDNRWENLRNATRVQNRYNTVARSASGYKGVYLHKSSGRWNARIQTPNKKEKSLGYFSTPEAAFAVADAARKELHGEFYRGAE
jgi:hypothetical protein